MFTLQVRFSFQVIWDSAAIQNKLKKNVQASKNISKFNYWGWKAGITSLKIAHLTGSWHNLKSVAHRRPPSDHLRQEWVEVYAGTFVSDTAPFLETGLFPSNPVWVSWVAFQRFNTVQLQWI